MPASGVVALGQRLHGRAVRAIVVCCGLMSCVAQTRAQFDHGLLHLRTSVGAAAMVSEDQTGRLGFDALGLLGQLQLGYALSPWLDLHVGLGGGGFPSEGPTGGLLAPLLGAALRLPSRSLQPFLQLDVGAGFTGPFARPFFIAAIGAETPVGAAISLGPVFGYGQLIQKSGSRQSSDARFLWFGLSGSWRAASPERPAKQRTHVLTRYREVERPALNSEPPPAAAAEPSPELLVLLEEALPSARTELLAPVLFQFDSDELEPTGVAMLHEVQRELERRPQIQLLEICGYADQRGSAEHNFELSERRAARVLQWLVEHGVAPERLRLAPRGATGLVERGTLEHEHEQNRRVVFRVVETSKP